MVTAAATAPGTRVRDRVGAPGLGPLVLACGVVLPAITIAYELASHACMALFFDPLPTWPHALLVGAVPAIVLGAHLALRRGDARTARRADAGLAFTSGVAGIYTLLCMPLWPPAAVLLVMSPLLLFSSELPALQLPPISLMPFVPALAWIAVVRAGVKLRSTFPSRSRAQRLRWTALALAVFALAEAPGVLVHVAYSPALDDFFAPGSRADARLLGLLRRAGSEGLMLRALRDGPAKVHAAGAPLAWLLDSRGRSRRAEERFFRATGRVPDDVVWPGRVGADHVHFSLLDFGRGRAAWDFDQGGERVGQRLDGLSLASSTLRGEVHGDDAFAYLEWTLVFRNDAATPSEARSLVELPPGAVVSRATLWVDGVPREAAFGGHAQVRRAYQSVVNRGRDPLLVTSPSPGRVLVQCFPVPPEGGEMQVRLGITAPLQLLVRDRGLLVLPRLVTRNFDVATRHALSFRGTAPLALLPHAGEGPAAATLETELPDAALQRTPQAVAVARSAERRQLLAVDWRGQARIRQRVEPALPELRHLVVVVDASRSAAEVRDALGDGLRSLARHLELTLVLAADEPVVLGTGSDALAALARADMGWGQRNAPGLERAVSQAAERPGGAILWIHGPQPVAGRSFHLAAKALAESRAPLIDFALRPGPAALRELVPAAGVVSVARTGSLEDDLAALARSLAEGGPWRSVRRRDGTLEAPASADTLSRTSIHLSRLWAWEEAQRAALAGGDPASFGRHYEIVTPWTGAVVLERDEQYAAAGLALPQSDPDDPSLEPPSRRSVSSGQPAESAPEEVEPTSPIPEPTAGLLFGIAMAVFALRRRAARRTG